MAAYTHEEYEGNGLVANKPEICFFCGKSLKDPELDVGGLVFWKGKGAQLALHQSCSLVLSLTLIQDARSLVTITKQEMKIDTFRRKDRKGVWFSK